MSAAIDETHDPILTSWVASANAPGDFPIQNLPFGVFSTPGGDRRGGVAIGDQIVDLAAAAGSDLLEGEARAAAGHAAGPSLNAFLALGSASRSALRRRLSTLLRKGADGQGEVVGWLRPSAGCVLHMPARVGDYTDFYAGIHHALNVGRRFRPESPLLPNYKYMPVAYHGRASSVRPSGASVRRPLGQRLAPGETTPVFGPSRRLDLELELGVWIGGPANALGDAIPIDAAADRIAGLCLLNDWSARDLQTWEYQPLGPFLAKNFMTTISPWIVTAEALAPFRIPQPLRPEGDPPPLPHLWNPADQAGGAYAIDLEVLILTPLMRRNGQAPHRLGGGPAANLYWTVAQMVTHHASGGCDLNPGDLLGTGTISTPDESGLGSLLEMSRGGEHPVTLPNGEVRSFLEDGDELILAGRAWVEGHVAIGFGECRGVVTSAAAP